MKSDRSALGSCKTHCFDFETLDIENSNENDESEINEKDEKTVTLDNPITNKTKEVPFVIIDWFMILKAIKKSRNCYCQI